MFVQIGLLFILFLFGVSFLIVIAACVSAPTDERLDRQETAMIASIKEAGKQQQRYAVRIPLAPPNRHFLGAFEHFLPSPPQES